MFPQGKQGDLLPCSVLTDFCYSWHLHTLLPLPLKTVEVERDQMPHIEEPGIPTNSGMREVSKETWESGAKVYAPTFYFLLLIESKPLFPTTSKQIIYIPL